MSARLRAWVIRLLDRIDPPYGAHAKTPGERDAGMAASLAPPCDSGWLPAPDPRSGRGQHPDRERDRMTRPILAEVLPTRFDASPEAARRLHRALLTI